MLTMYTLRLQYDRHPWFRFLSSRTGIAASTRTCRASARAAQPAPIRIGWSLARVERERHRCAIRQFQCRIPLRPRFGVQHGPQGDHAFAGTPLEPEARCQLDDTASRRLGTGVHTYVLEPKRFALEYVVYEGRRQGNDWELFQATHLNKTILSRQEYVRVVGCGEETLISPAVQGQDAVYTVEDLIEHGTVERNTYWVDEETGLTCRMRADLMIQNITVDLKTTDDARADAFANQCGRLGYDLQTAFYTRGRRAFGRSTPKGTPSPSFWLQANWLTPMECRRTWSTTTNS